MHNPRRERNDLLQQRAAALDAASAALDTQDQAAYDSSMAQVEELNGAIDRLDRLEKENARFAARSLTHPNEAMDRMAEQGDSLRRGGEVTFTPKDIAGALGLKLDGRGPENSTTLATGTLVEPAGAGGNIRDGFFTVPSILDDVTVTDLTGMGSYTEPYVVSELTAQAGKVTTLAGTARTASDPTFAYAAIKPYEVDVTSYVDRNISRLSPAAYFAKVQGMAMRALRRKVAALIMNGDGQATPDMYGIKTAKNAAGEEIFKTYTAGTEVGPDLLTELMFQYGGNDELGAGARLYLTKADLLALGKLRGTNEKKRLFEITKDGGNGNRGTITDGGLIIPYALSSDLTTLSGNTKKSDKTMVYGDPANYELGLFGGYTIRIDESVKAVERMIAILGDVMVGGNLVVHEGFVVATTPSA